MHLLSRYFVSVPLLYYQYISLPQTQRRTSTSPSCGRCHVTWRCWRASVLWAETPLVSPWTALPPLLAVWSLLKPLLAVLNCGQLLFYNPCQVFICLYIYVLSYTYIDIRVHIDEQNKRRLNRLSSALFRKTSSR